MYPGFGSFRGIGATRLSQLELNQPGTWLKQMGSCRAKTGLWVYFRFLALHLLPDANSFRNLFTQLIPKSQVGGLWACLSRICSQKRHRCTFADGMTPKSIRIAQYPWSKMGWPIRIAGNQQDWWSELSKDQSFLWFIMSLCHHVVRCCSLSIMSFWIQSDFAECRAFQDSARRPRCPHVRLRHPWRCQVPSGPRCFFWYETKVFKSSTNI